MSSEITLSKNTNRSHKFLYPYLFCILFYIFLYLFSLEIFREMYWKCAHFKLVFNSEFSLCILNGNWNGSIGYDSDGNPDFLANDWQFGHLRSQHQTRPNQLIALKRNCLKTRIFDNLDKSDKYMEKNLIDIFLITLERSNNKSIHKDFWVRCCFHFYPILSLSVISACVGLKCIPWTKWFFTNVARNGVLPCDAFQCVGL